MPLIVMHAQTHAMQFRGQDIYVEWISQPRQKQRQKQVQLRI